MTTTRVVPILTVGDIDAERDHYIEVLGLSEVMNHGWIATLADESGHQQISLMTTDQTAPVNPSASIEVDDVDASYATALEQGLDIVHELQDEPWSVRRFSFATRQATSSTCSRTGNQAPDRLPAGRRSPLSRSRGVPIEDPIRAGAR